MNLKELEAFGILSNWGYERKINPQVVHAIIGIVGDINYLEKRSAQPPPIATTIAGMMQLGLAVQLTREMTDNIITLDQQVKEGAEKNAVASMMITIIAQVAFILDVFEHFPDYKHAGVIFREYQMREKKRAR